MNKWFYHPESEALFMDDSEDPAVYQECVELGPVVAGDEDEGNKLLLITQGPPR